MGLAPNRRESRSAVLAILYKEIDRHLKIALDEIGEIKPWFDKEVDAWIFEHKTYLVEYGGDSKEDVIQNYPKYLREFIRQRLNDNLAPSVEKKRKDEEEKERAQEDLKVRKRNLRNVYIYHSM